MAAIFIVAGLMIAEKVEKKKEKKRQKKADAEARYRELQIETNRRLARRDSGAAIDNSYVDEPDDDEYDDANQRLARDDVPPPAYEDAVQITERREREWQAEMQRRRSSLTSSQGRTPVSA